MEFEKVELACGSPLHVMELPHLRSVSMAVLMNAGTRDEQYPHEAGIAHAFEHLVFRGSSRFPTSKKISAHVDKDGGGLGAWTSHEGTCFFGQLLTKRMDCLVECLYHLLRQPLFREKDCEIEIQPIIEEILGGNDDPDVLIDDTFREIAYGSHPLGRKILGTRESLQGLTREHLLDYHKTYCHPGNFTFFALGNITARDVQASFDRFFESSWSGPKNIRTPQPEILRSSNAKVILKDIEQVHAYIGTPVGPGRERETKAIGFFSHMLDGDSMSYPLFQEVRDKLGLCYSIGASLEKETDHSLFSIAINTEIEKLQRALSTIYAVIEKSKNNKTLFAKTKRRAVGQLTLAFEKPANIIESAIAKCIYEETKSPATIIREIESLEFEEVKAAAERWMQPEKFVCVCISPKNFKS